MSWRSGLQWRGSSCGGSGSPWNVDETSAWYGTQPDPAVQCLRVCVCVYMVTNLSLHTATLGGAGASEHTENYLLANREIP